jgi:hypothetical protein
MLSQREEIEAAVGPCGETAEQLVGFGQGGCVGQRSGQVICGMLQLSAEQG